MKCLICLQKIKFGEQIFWGNQVECRGSGEDDFSYSEASEGLVGGICLLCLKNPAAVARTPNMATPEPVEEELVSIVKRSDALSILNGA